jgi:hypothetical protein
MSLTYQRSRITGAGLVAAQYDLTLERQTTIDNIFFIPGIANPVSEINQLLFGQGQQGTFIAPSLTPSVISGSTFGTGVETLPDLSPRNNPFSQATPASRSAWFREPRTGRRNLFLRTEDFTSSVWSKTNVNIAGAGNIVIPTTTNGTHRIFQNVTVAEPYSFSVEAKAEGYNLISLAVAGGLAGQGYFFNLSTGIVSGSAAGYDASILPLGDGWFRCALIRSATNPPAALNRFVIIRQAESTDDYAGDGVSGVALRTQIETGSTQTAYQLVTNAFDVSESGQRDCYGLRFDGNDDGYVTNTINWGTGKVTIFVAIRRRSDAARGTVLELTPSIDSNNGAFHLTAPNAASATFGFESKGTTLRDVVIAQAMGNPRIITAIGDIGSGIASIQVNDGTPVTNTGDQGVGNYSDAVLHLGRRGESSLELNGDIFAVIAVGGLVSASIAARVRAILNETTPEVSL